jgi:aromatic ring-cleaving dioxygenase
MKPDAPYHAHVYYDAATRAAAQRLQETMRRLHAGGELADLVFIGEMRDRNVGPHPKPQFELHFRASALAKIEPILHASGLAALVHPLTDDDLADHTSLARWIGEPLALDTSVLDPPGMNQGVARFGKSDV